MRFLHHAVVIFQTRIVSWHFSQRFRVQIEVEVFLETRSGSSRRASPDHHDLVLTVSTLFKRASKSHPVKITSSKVESGSSMLAMA